MAVFNNILAGASGATGADAGYQIDRSLRFNSGDSAYLNRTPSSAGNRKTWTLSFWVKRTKLTNNVNGIFSVHNASITEDNYAIIQFNTDDTLNLTYAYASYKTTTRKFRDPSAWYHIVVAVDTTNSTASDRIQIYVNGVKETSFSTTHDPDLNQDLAWNQAAIHRIGVETIQYYSDCYFAEINFIDGQALAATDFGEYDDNNVWQPKEFTGSYNASGFTPGANISYGSWADVFNGSTTGHAFTYSSATSTATLSPGIAWSSKVRIYGLQYSTSHVKINGGSALTGFSTTAAWVDVTSQVGSSGTLTSVEINDVGTNYFKLFAIELDDTILDLSQVGVNGFHLDFKDNSSNATLGKNSAVADDFTSTVGALTTTKAADFYSVGSYPANNLFDGSTSTIVFGGYDSSSTNSDLIWTPNGAYSASSSLRVYVGYYSTVYVNGVSKATGGESTGAGWVTLSHTGSITSIKFENTSNANVVRAAAIEIDGTIVETTAWTVNNLTANAPTGSLYSQATGSATSAFSNANLVGAFPAFSTGGNYIYDAELDTSVTTVTFNYKYGFGGVEILVSNDGTNWTSKGTQTQAYTTISDSNPFKYVRWFISAVWGHGITDDPANNDSLIDTPTAYEAASGNNGGNYATLNPLDRNDSPTYSQGNLVTTGSGAAHCVGRATVGVSSGKWYWEVQINSAINSTYYPSPGICSMEGFVPNQLGDATTSHAYMANGQKYTNSTLSSYGASFAQNDIIGFALDMDAGTLVAYKNGTSQGTMATGLTGTWSPTAGHYSSTSLVYNFGQRPFVYSPPSGYKSLCSTNLPDPTIADGSTAFDTKTYTGTGNALNITGLNFSPDLVWIKNRSSGYSHCLYDTVRGVGKRLASDGTYGEDTYNLLTNFNAYGFSLGSGFVQNASGVTSVAWTWDGGDLASSSDTTNYDQSQTWTSYVTGTASPSYGITNLFNGDGTGLSYSDGTAATVGNTLTFQPSTAITGVNTLVLGTYGNIAFTVNGTSVSAPSSLGLEVTIDKATYFSNGVLSNISWGYTNGSNYMYLTYIKINGKLLINPGVIAPGGLNSSAYDQSQNWSSTGTTTNTSLIANAFNGSTSNGSYANANTVSRYTFASVQTGTKFELYIDCSLASTNFSVNGQVPSAVSGAMTPQWVDVTDAVLASGTNGLSYFEVAYTPAVYSQTVYAVRIDGKILADSTATPPDVPTIPSTVRANPSAGFSIVSYTGSGSVATVGHGLNAAPEFIITKARSNSTNWVTGHTGIGWGNFLFLDTTAAAGASAAVWNSTAPDSNVFSLASSSYINPSGSGVIAYCFAPVEGYSAFGSYTGNGSTDGPFVFTGFRPRWVITKNISSTGLWNLHDTERSDSNPTSKLLWADDSSSEVDYAGGAFTIDCLSNGFKVRASTSSINTNGNTYIYAAFAEHPFKTARAR